VPKIPAYQVRIVDAASGAVVVEQKLTEGPTNDDRSLVEHRYGADWERVRVRHKTDDGDMHVVFRYLDRNNHYITEQLDARVDKPVEVAKPNGARFRVDVLKVPESEWKTIEALEFKAPKVSVTADAGGWHIRFEPQQRPCVCTVAIDGASKPEGLPSIPFPSSMPASGTLYLQRGEFGAEDGAIIRLGVRGAGMTVRLKLPEAGTSVDVAPETFDRSGTPNASMLTEAYVQGKYNENAALIAQRIRYG
jgi:hypothetical protein